MHQSDFNSHLVLGLLRERGIEDFWWNLEKLPMKIKVKKCVCMGYVVECVEESREREKERRQMVVW